ncbi:MAG: DNA/RNA nuclease SfsA [Chloroflexota bacterium]
MGEKRLTIFRDLLKAEFVARPNRFVVECRLDGRMTRCHLPNPGRLWELLLPGRTVHLVHKSKEGQRSTDFTCVAVEREGHPVMLHTHHTNTVARWLIDSGGIPGLECFSVVRPEVAIGGSRFDFLLSDGREELVLEVKSCTLFSEDIAMFPDAVTTRGRKHLETLADLSRRGLRAGVLFVVHSPRARCFMPEYHTDPLFSQTLCDIKDDLLIRAIGVKWEGDLSLMQGAKRLAIPWSLVKEEAQDRGSYILVLRLGRRRRLPVGGLGIREFRQGYYLYVGSAARNLQKRISRHQRTGKKLHWHIDYLREESQFIAALPILASTPLECEIAAAIRSIADWTVCGFGSSDCACESHLFGMEINPIVSPRFIDLLHEFRINRLHGLLGRGCEEQA